MNASTDDWWESTVFEYQEEAAANTLEDGVRTKAGGNLSIDDLLENLTWARELGVPRVWLLTHATVAVPPELHLLVAFILTTIGVLGTAGNAIVVFPVAWVGIQTLYEPTTDRTAAGRPAMQGSLN